VIHSPLPLTPQASHRHRRHPGDTACVCRRGRHRTGARRRQKSSGLCARTSHCFRKCALGSTLLCRTILCHRTARLTAREKRTAAGVETAKLLTCHCEGSPPRCRVMHSSGYHSAHLVLLARQIVSQSWCCGGRAGTIRSGSAGRPQRPASPTAFTSGFEAAPTSCRGRMRLHATPKATRRGAGARLAAASRIAAALLKDCSIVAPRLTAADREGDGTVGDGCAATPKAM
jgi:hypothetical protein